MTCFICKTGTPKEGTTTVPLERGETVVIIKDVPARVCENCGEYYISDQVSKRMYARAEEAVKRKVKLEVLHYAT